MPSWRTIYRWIYEKYLVNGNLKVLRRKGKSHGSKETRGKYSKGKSIRKRDRSVYSRKEAGHWEADTVVSGQGKSKACFATLAERKTRFYIAVKIPDRRAETMENAIVAALSAFPPQLVKTITCDRGTEFANWRRIEERLHCEVYFADILCLAERYKRESERPAPGVLSQGQEPFPCCSRHIKTKPGVVERQASQSSVLPFCSGIMGLRAQFLLHLV